MPCLIIFSLSLSHTHKHWFSGTPQEDILQHVANAPPMEHLHKLNYAVTGEEACVAMIQDAPTGQFGKPQGNCQPLIVVLLGPPHKRKKNRHACRHMNQPLIHSFLPPSTSFPFEP